MDAREDGSFGSCSFTQSAAAACPQDLFSLGNGCQAIDIAEEHFARFFQMHFEIIE